MKAITAAFKSHLAQAYQTTCTCWKVTLTNGTVKAFTDHDQNVTFNSVTYLAASGYSASDISTSAGMNVSNMEVVGMLVNPSISEADLNAGLWDYAAIEIFMVNWADTSPTMGRIISRVGHLGQVSYVRNAFKAEIRGLAALYALNVVDLYTPSCTATLGDAKCTKALGAFTFTGTVSTVNTDNVTFYDPGLTQAGPAGGVAITGITNANPGVVTVAAPNKFTNLQTVTISGVVGPVALNTVVVVHNPSGSTFQLGFDTSNTGTYPAYVSGGTVSPMGSAAGYFDFGIVTWTSGLNNGLKMDIASFVTGQVKLFLPMAYAIAPGDTYSIVAGCSKDFPTCRDKFANAVNFRGFPYLPGQDKVLLVGRQSG